MSVLSNSKLEKRLAKLERLVTERSAGGVEANLFSDEFEEVKAAVDEGQDVNQTNGRGQTPLLFAAATKAGNNSDIIEYLLTHGADLSFEFGSFNAFELASENSNIEAMKVILANDTQNIIDNPSKVIGYTDKRILRDRDLIPLAGLKERHEFNFRVHGFYYSAYTHGTISREQYEQIIDVMLDNCTYVGANKAGIEYEIRNEFLSIIKKIADKAKILVDISGPIEVNNKISANFARQLLKLCDEAIDGRLSVQWSISYFIATCRKLCKRANDQSLMSKLLNPTFLSNLKYEDLRSIFYDSVKYSNVDTLSKLVAIKVKIDANDVCGYLCLQSANEKVTRLATRLIDRNTQLSSNVVGYIAKCSNEYLIHYVIDMGYGEALLAKCMAYFRQGCTTAVRILREYGLEEPDYDDRDSRKRLAATAGDIQSRRDEIIRIVRAIKYDTGWDVELERLVTNNPEILLDSSVTKAIEDSDTVISGQLRRRLERIPRDQDKYDF